MAVPLFDTRRRSRRCARRCTPSSPRCSTPARYILGPEVAAFERELAAYLGVPSRGRRGQRHGRARARAARAGRRARRRRRRALVHVLRLGRGDRAHRRQAGLLRRRPGDVLRHAGHRPRGADAATKVVMAVHLFGNVAPVAEIEALGVPGARGRRAGARLAHAPTGAAPARWGRAATFSFFPSKNLGAFGDGGAVATADDGAGRARARCCASTARATRCRSSSSATTRAWTSCRRRCCGSSCRSSTPGATAAAPPAAHYAEAGLGELAACPSRSTAATPPGTST